MTWQQFHTSLDPQNSILSKTDLSALFTQSFSFRVLLMLKINHKRIKSTVLLTFAKNLCKLLKVEINTFMDFLRQRSMSFEKLLSKSLTWGFENVHQVLNRTFCLKTFTDRRRSSATRRRVGSRSANCLFSNKSRAERRKNFVIVEHVALVLFYNTKKSFNGWKC